MTRIYSIEVEKTSKSNRLKKQLMEVDVLEGLNVD